MFLWWCITVFVHRVFVFWWRGKCLFSEVEPFLVVVCLCTDSEGKRPSSNAYLFKFMVCLCSGSGGKSRSGGA